MLAIYQIDSSTSTLCTDPLTPLRSTRKTRPTRLAIAVAIAFSALHSLIAGHRVGVRTLILLWMTASALLTGCSVQVLDAKRIGVLDANPTEIAFIWATAEGPTSLSILPALSLAMPGFPHNYFANYRTEENMFVASLEARVTGEGLFKPTKFVKLHHSNSPAQLKEAVDSFPESTAIVEMYAQRAVAYCKPGCYAFKVRVDYLAPRSHTLIWTALFDLPPKTMHSAPYDPVTDGFTKALATSFATERLLP